MSSANSSSPRCRSPAVNGHRLSASPFAGRRLSPPALLRPRAATSLAVPSPQQQQHHNQQQRQQQHIQQQKQQQQRCNKELSPDFTDRLDELRFLRCISPYAAVSAAAGSPRHCRAGGAPRSTSPPPPAALTPQLYGLRARQRHARQSNSHSPRPHSHYQLLFDHRSYSFQQQQQPQQQQQHSPYQTLRPDVRLTVDSPSQPAAMPHDSRPDIAAWPAPPVEPTAVLLSVSSASKPASSPAPAGHYTPVFELSLASSCPSQQQQQQSHQCQQQQQQQYSLSAYRSQSSTSAYGQSHAKSMSPAAHSIAAAASAVAAAAATVSSADRQGRYGDAKMPSPRPMSRTPQPYDNLSASSGSMSNFVEDTSKLLTMLKAVAASSPGSTLGRESELRQKIQALEKTVAEYERQKFNVMGTFSEYRERVAERERKLEAEYSNRIITLSEEVLGAKKDFETRMKSFQALQEQFEREKEQALEKLRQEHQKEIQVLEQRFSESQLLNLEQKYIIEIQRLEEERKSLKTEKERLGETFEMKLKRAQSLYETELTAAKLLYTRELAALREHEDALKEELAARQEEFHDRLQEIQHQARASKDEMNHCKSEVALLEGKLRKKEAEVQDISRTLSTARNETNAALLRLNDATSELSERRAERDAQKAELEQKSRLLNAAESARMQLEATIRDLQTEVKALRNRVDFLEMERDNLQGQSDSQTQLHNSQVQALEAVLESVTKEKESTREHYEKLLEQEREQAEEREYSIKQEFSTKLNELEDQYNALREHLEHNAGAFEPDNVRLWEEIESLRSEKRLLEDEVYGLRSQLTQDQAIEANEVSLEGIIALLKAIDVVKRKANFYGGGGDKSAGTPSPEAIVVPATVSEATGASDTGPAMVPGPSDEEDRVLSEEETMRAISAAISGESAKIAAAAAAAAGGRLRLTITDAEGNLRAHEHFGDTIDLEAVLRKIKEIESSLDAIAAEKNQAYAKVEQLSEENRILIEKLDHFQALSHNSQQQQQQYLNGRESSNNNNNNNVVNNNGEVQRLQKCLADYRARVAELEASAKAAKESYEARLEAQNLASEEQQTATIGTLQAKINDYEARLRAATVELESLRKQAASSQIVRNANDHTVDIDQVERLKAEHDEQIRKLEARQAMQMEGKIVSLNREHEHTVELMRQQEMELKARYDELRVRIGECEPPEESEAQTDGGLGDRATEERREVEALQRRVDELLAENRAKEEEMKKLRISDIINTPLVHVPVERRDEGIQCDAFLQQPSSPPPPPSTSPTRSYDGPADDWESKQRKDRSQSMLATPEHLAMCQKAARRFHSMVEQKKSKCALRPPAHTADGIAGAKSRLYCKERLAAAKGEHSLSPSPSYASSSASSGSSSATAATVGAATAPPTAAAWRDRSPGCYRERSPSAKLRSQLDDVAPQHLTVPQHQSSTAARALLSPSEAEIRRRLSPARQLYFNKNAEKRPAWKF